MFPDLGSTQQQVAVLVGFFLPLLLAIPIQSHWPTELKTLFSVAAYAAAGAVTAAATGDLTGKSFWQTTLEILVLGVVGYQGVWKPANLAPAIEARTNVSTHPAQPAGDGTGAVASPGGVTPVRTVTLSPTVEDLFAAGTRLVDELTNGLHANRAGNGATSAETGPEHEAGASQAATGAIEEEKAAAAWVRPGPR